MKLYTQTNKIISLPVSRNSSSKNSFLQKQKLAFTNINTKANEDYYNIDNIYEIKIKDEVINFSKVNGIIILDKNLLDDSRQIFFYDGIKKLCLGIYIDTPFFK